MNCYFVFGPESSGNRLMARLLIEAGCYGHGAVAQPIEEILQSGRENIVVHFSFPYGHRSEGRYYPDIEHLSRMTEKLGYRSRAVVMIRDFMATTHSQLTQDHVETLGEGMSNYNEALMDIFAGLRLSGLPFVVVTYESLIQHREQLLLWLFPMLELPIIVPNETIVDANAKWYESLLAVE